MQNCYLPLQESPERILTWIRKKWSGAMQFYVAAKNDLCHLLSICFLYCRRFGPKRVWWMPTSNSSVGWLFIGEYWVSHKKHNSVLYKSFPWKSVDFSIFVFQEANRSLSSFWMQDTSLVTLKLTPIKRISILFSVQIYFYYLNFSWPSRLGLQNAPTASLPRCKTPPTSLLGRKLNNLMVRFQ